MKLMLVNALILSACLSCSKSDDKSGGGGATGSPTTVDANGNVAYAFDPASTSAGTIAINDSSAISGSEILIPAGTLAVATAISVEEGDASSPAIATALGVAEAPKTASASVIVRTADPTLIPLQTLSISLPLNVAPGLQLAQDKLVVLALYWTASGVKMGVVTSDKVTIVGNKAKFSSANFGQFQLAYLSADPTVLEVASTKSIVSKKESLKPQSLYVIGQQEAADKNANSIGGIYKDGVWAPLSVTITGGQAYPWSIYFHNSKQYVAGTMGDALTYDDPNHKEIPGIWIDSVWTAYSLPEGKARCYDLVLAFDATHRVHMTGKCSARDDSLGGKVTVWIDGVLTALPAGFEDGPGIGIAADLKGNILLTSKTGYYVNYKDLVTLTNPAGTSPRGNLGVAPNGDIYLGAGSGSVANGYWLNKVWKEGPTEAHIFAFLPGGEVLYTFSNGQKAVIVRGEKETALSCDIASEYKTIGVYSFMVNRDGDILAGGGCNGTQGIWKNGVYTKLPENSDLMDFTVY